MNHKQRLVEILVVAFWLVSHSYVNAGLLIYEGFDTNVGSLDGQAGATSFGFDPVLGTQWDSGIFGSPLVGAGSITAPGSVAGFYAAAPTGNRVVEDFQSTVIGRPTDVSAQHLYGTWLATMNLADGHNSHVLLDNFWVHATDDANGAADATWRVQTSGGTFDSGIAAQGTALISWELEFDPVNSLLPDTLRVWFNSNPLIDAPDILRTTDDLGQFDLGGITLTNNIFLGQSQVGYDEFRIGTDWHSVGISSVPEPGFALPLVACLLFRAAFARRRKCQCFSEDEFWCGDG